MRLKVAAFHHSALSGLYEKLAGLSQFFDPFILLDSNDKSTRYSRYDWICAFGAVSHLKRIQPTVEDFTKFRKEHPDSWLFGHISYDFKNQLEDLKSNNIDDFNWPLLYFFVPENVIYRIGDTIYFESSRYKNPLEIFKEVRYYGLAKKYLRVWRKKIKLNPTIEKSRYLDFADKIKNHLQFGNIYELNYCIQFEGSGNLDVPKVYEKLNQAQKAPYSALYRLNHNYLLCSSPERFLARRGNKIIAQPIKGTSPRNADPQIDLQNVEALKKSEKERAENVMIVDLMRNDLSKTALKNSVQVEELFGIESFNAVHQMVSTITSEVHPDTPVEEVLFKSFPMGSMTGAPKVMAMQLIEDFEDFGRGLYSGSVGYISPDGDFDFNVVIRSLFYNTANEQIAVRVGSALTINANPEKEYEECLLKAGKILEQIR